MIVFSCSKHTSKLNARRQILLFILSLDLKSNISYHDKPFQAGMRAWWCRQLFLGCPSNQRLVPVQSTWLCWFIDRRSAVPSEIGGCSRQHRLVGMHKILPIMHCACWKPSSRSVTRTLSADTKTGQMVLFIPSRTVQCACNTCSLGSPLMRQQYR